MFRVAFSWIDKWMGEYRNRANESIEIQNSFFGEVESSGVYRNLNKKNHLPVVENRGKHKHKLLSSISTYTRCRCAEHNFSGKSN